MSTQHPTDARPQGVHRRAVVWGAIWTALGLVFLAQAIWAPHLHLNGSTVLLLAGMALLLAASLTWLLRRRSPRHPEPVLVTAPAAPAAREAADVDDDPLREDLADLAPQHTPTAPTAEADPAPGTGAPAAADPADEPGQRRPSA